MLLTKEVEIIPIGKTIGYYENRGYDVKCNKSLMVSVEDLPRNSKAKVRVKCDICGCEKEITYQNYNNSLDKGGYYSCKNCAKIKYSETIYQKYGVQNIFQTQECKDKIKSTLIEKYNCDNPMKSKQFKQKQQDALMEHYGVKVPLQNKEIMERAKNTTFEHYGYYYASQSDEFKAVVANTMMEKYDVKYPMQSLEIREKANKTLCENGRIRTSKQQLYIHHLYGGELNYPISCSAVDICFPDEKLVIEYDGGGHNLRVTLGELTQEEYNTKELIRDKMIKSKGYKQMRIISSKDLLPSDEVLLQLLSHARQYFSEFPSHSWISYNFDTSEFRNAENKEGVYYDFGELRRISKSDVETSVEASTETSTSTASDAAD